MTNSEDKMHQGRKYIAIFWFCALLYALLAMVAFRELLIPHFFALSVNGHLPADPYYYHSLAVYQADKIRQSGLTEFSLHLQGQGIAGLTSLIYLIWDNPYSVIMLNAVLHATSAVILVLILNHWFRVTISIVSSTPLILSPYMMLWYSQISKESLAMTGSLLIIYAALRLGKVHEVNFQATIQSTLAIVLCGILCLWLVRPYMNMVLLPFVGSFLILIACINVRFFCVNKLIGFKYIISSLALIALMLTFSSGAASDSTIRSFQNDFSFIGSQKQPSQLEEMKSISESCFINIDSQNWQDSQFLPELVDDKLKALMGQRCLIFTILDTHDNPTTLRSIIDYNVLPSGSHEALLYIPRSIVVGTLLPGPANLISIFTEEFSIFYAIAGLEALLLYIGLASLLIWVLQTKQFSILFPIGAAIAASSVIAMATPFLGALYRCRYPWWILMMCIGLACSISLIYSKYSLMKTCKSKPNKSLA